MKKAYETPSLAVIVLRSVEIVTESPEENMDNSVSFGDLFKKNLSQD